jgi:hypothetical protein
MCAALACSVAPMRADSRTRLTVTFDAAHVLAIPIRHAALVEAAHIWDAYDIVLDEVADACAAARPPRVTVAIDGTAGPARSEMGLGAIRFGADGIPESAITLYLDAIVKIATGAPVMGLHPSLWPSALRDEIVARAVGRALAHEIGHFLLRSPQHAGSGLMRATQKGSALGDPNRKPFALSSPDRQRLQLALAAPSVASARDLDSACCCPVVANR